MIKRITCFTMLVLLLFLCGCSIAGHPLAKVEATVVPGLSMELHAASASKENTDEFVVTLYFRYMNQPMLASENRVLDVKRDESTELALLRALLEGPSAGHVELTRLFPDTIHVESASSRDDILFITLNKALLSNADIPEDWQSQAQWASEAPLLRRLQIQSLVASITESFPYNSVEIMVNKTGDAKTGVRLDKSYFLTGDVGPSDPITREESLLLTPQNTAQCILLAWQQRDYEALYAYTATQGSGEPRPTYDAFTNVMDTHAALSAYTVSGGSISSDGQSAVLTVSLSILQNGSSYELTAYPLRLTRENGIWKITHHTLLSMMSN